MNKIPEELGLSYMESKFLPHNIYTFLNVNKYNVLHNHDL